MNKSPSRVHQYLPLNYHVRLYSTDQVIHLECTYYFLGWANFQILGVLRFSDLAVPYGWSTGGHVVLMTSRPCWRIREFMKEKAEIIFVRQQPKCCRIHFPPHHISDVALQHLFVHVAQCQMRIVMAQLGSWIKSNSESNGWKPISKTRHWFGSSFFGHSHFFWTWRPSKTLYNVISWNDPKSDVHSSPQKTNTFA